jgi:ribokinase
VASADDGTNVVRVGDLDVLVVGDVNPDLVLTGDVRPRFGQAEQILDRASLVLGGSAAITASGCARLGLATAMVARVGSDVFGDFVREELRAAGVDTATVRDDAVTPTGMTVMLSEPDDRAMLTFPGTIAGLRRDDVSTDLLARARHIHVASFFLQPALAPWIAEIFSNAHSLGLTTSLDTNWDPSESWSGVREVLAHTDVFLPNAAELLAIAGRDPYSNDPELIEAAGVELAALGPIVAVKDGARGAHAWWQGGRASAPGLALEVVDTTGAGDSFNAGFLSGYLAGEPIERCVAYAATAGSLSTRAAGGTAAQADRSELLAALVTPNQYTVTVDIPAQPVGDVAELL